MSVYFVDFDHKVENCRVLNPKSDGIENTKISHIWKIFQGEEDNSDDRLIAAYRPMKSLKHKTKVEIMTNDELVTNISVVAFFWKLKI